MTLHNETDATVRPGLSSAIDLAWMRLAQPGSWWTGSERVSIAEETRNAMSCRVCRERKAALSPSHVAGEHDALGVLDAAAVDAIHRVRTDAARLTEAWLGELLQQGLTDAQYVEIVGVVATVAAVDTFDRAMGSERRDLPAAIDGEPDRYRPAAAISGLGWLPTLQPQDLLREYPNPQAGYGTDNIHRALSLVPAEVAAFFDLDTELYLCDRESPRRAQQVEERALSEMQIEMIAARAASSNGCYY